MSYASWDGKVVWLHMCNLATTEAHSKTLESGFLNILMWCACETAPSQSRKTLSSIANPPLLRMLLPVYAADWVATSPRTSAAAFASVVHSRSSLGALRPEDTERQPAFRCTHLLNLIQFHSSLILQSPWGNLFQIKCIARWCKNTTYIIQNRRGNLTLQMRKILEILMIVKHNKQSVY